MPKPFPIKNTLSIASLITTFFATNLHAQSMTDLGTLSGTSSYALAISADGLVIAGYGAITGGAFHAFKYVGTTMTDLGTLGGTRSMAYGVSGDGSVIVGSSYPTGSTSNHAFKYVGATMTDLGTLGGAVSSAYAVSGDGLVIVGDSAASDGRTRAFKYIGTTMTDLGTLGGLSGSAYGVSSDGSVIVGASQTIAGDLHAFKYVGTTMTDLGTLGGLSSRANAVSADGTVIVGQSLIAGGGTTNHAFKYVGTTMTDLGTLGGTNSYATAVSGDGSVIVGYSSATGGVHAFKYVGTTMTDLGTLGGTTSRANGVSSDGLVIVGQSTTASGATHAFVYNNASPTPTPTPTISVNPLVDVDNTYLALTNSGYQLNSLLNAQNTSLAVNLNSDCTVYGANNICVGIGGRYTNVSNPSASQTAGNIQLGYRFHSAIRAGIFLDQGISNTTPNGYIMKNSQPLAGVFAVFSPSGTSLGLQVKVSGAYGNNGVNITRNTMSNTEAGQGSSTMTTQGAQLETAYGFTLVDSWIASPLLGIKATQVSRSAYTETAGATFPISYNTVNQAATTTYAGAKVFGYVAPKVSIGASIGVEQDLSSSIDSYSGSIYFLGAFSQNAPAIQRTRAFVGANTDYWIEKNQRVSLGVYYNQQSLNVSNGLTGMLSYTIGL